MGASSDVTTRNVQTGAPQAPSLERDIGMLVGLAPWGPPHSKQLVYSYDDFVTKYGGAYASGDLHEQVLQFFEQHREGKLWINRIVHLTNYATGRAFATAAKATHTAQTAATAPTQGTVTGSETAPFALANGDTLVGDVDAVGNQTATITAAAASLECTNAETYALVNGQTLTVDIDNTGVQTIEFLTGEFADIANATAEEVAAVIAAKLSGASVAVTTAGTKVTITSDTFGTDSEIDVTGGTANVALGFSTAPVNGTGNVADVSSVTIAELKTILEAALTNGGGVTVSDNGSGNLQVVANTAGSSGSIQIDATSTADDEIGLDNALHAGLDGTAVNTLKIDGKYEGARGNNLSYDILAASSGEASKFNLKLYENGVQAEDVFTDLDMDTVESTINGDAGSNLIAVTDLAAVGTLAQRRPANTTAQALSGGDDGLASLDDNDFIGHVDYGTGLYAFDEIKIGEAHLLAVPDRPVAAIIAAAKDYCVDVKKRTVVFIPDVPAGYTAAQAASFRTSWSSSADEAVDALCWPRIKIANPNKTVHGSDEQLVIANSGTLMGIMARNTAKYSSNTEVATQPGNEEQGRMSGVVGVESTESNKLSVREFLTTNRINPIVSGRDNSGVYAVWRNDVMGSDSSALFPSVGESRFASFVRATLIRYLDSIRNTPNSEENRATDRRVIEAFLSSYLGRDVYASNEADKAFYVNTDVLGESLNNPLVRRAEQYKVLVGLATAEPRRFIELLITRDNRARDLFIQQSVAQST